MRLPVPRPLLAIALPLLLLRCSGSGSPAADAARADLSTIGDGGTVDAIADRGSDAQQPRKISLPSDESPHFDPIEWWYYTGKLEAQSGEKYGFEFVVFQVDQKPLFGYMAHFAITDVSGAKFALDTKLSLKDQRGQKSGFKLTVGDWTLSGHQGKDSFSASMTGYGLDLSLTAKKPVVYQYGKGYMTIGSAKPFYYYSYTRMSASGTLTVGSTKKAVTGQAWMDHQWGDMGTKFNGWDWYSLRMDDQSELMLFIVRKTGQANFVGGTFVKKDGTYQELKASDFTVTSTGSWKSTHTKGVYPQGWKIKVPAYKLDATITPVMKDQEFYHTVFGSPVYWEGLCTIQGTRDGKPATGDAYVELTGYD